MPILELNFPCRLGRDPLGFPCGPGYVPMLRAGYDNSKGTGWSIPNPKTGTETQVLSTVERALIFDALIDPRIADVRTQYPMLDSQKIAKYLKDVSLRIPRSAVPTLDAVLTVRDAESDDGYSFEAVSVKTVEELADPAVQRRIERERSFCSKLGWPWYLYTDREVSRQRLETSRMIVHRVKNLNLESLRDQAASTAVKTKKFADGRSLKQVASAVARSLGMSQKSAFDCIAAAVIHGFLRLAGR